MAEVDERSDSMAEQRGPLASRLGSSRRDGSVPMIAAAAIAVAAIVMCVVLFVQVGSLKAKLQDATVPKPAGLQENGEAGSHGGEAVDEYAWQESPMEVTYELGEFQFNTSDGKHGLMDIALVLESGWTTEDRVGYEQALEYYSKELEKYAEEMQEYAEKQASRVAPPSGPVLAATAGPPMLRSGIALAMHTAPTPVEPPEHPGPPPGEPRTILEKQLDERQARVRDTVLRLVNNHSSAELITAAGKDAFKQGLMDELNSFIEDYYGRVIDVYFNQFVTT